MGVFVFCFGFVCGFLCFGSGGWCDLCSAICCVCGSVSLLCEFDLICGLLWLMWWVCWFAC